MAKNIMENNNYLYTKVKQLLVTYMKELPINTRLPSRTELVERFNVTRTTIERAISELIGEGYLYSRIGSGTYIISNSPAKKQQSESNFMNWGIIIPNIVNDTYPEILRSVEDICSESEINLIICNTDNNVEKQDKYIKKLVDSAVSGLIIVPAISKTQCMSSFELLEENNIKYVFCNRGVESLKAPKVVSNDFFGANVATKHLLKLGWKNPAYISRPYYSISEQRYNGYLSALYEFGLIANEDYVIFEDTFEIQDSGYETMKSLLQLPVPPDSVVCFNDIVAKGAYKAIEEMGLKVGIDIGVVGYDDSFVCETLPVKLTSVRFPKYEIGKKAAELLLSMINGVEVKDNYSAVLQPSLVIRESCGSGINFHLNKVI